MSDPTVTAGVELTPEMASLAEDFRAGSQRALARAITAVENERPGFEDLLDALHPGLGRARRVGVTGPPGAGKSTLTACLARRLRGEGHRVGIIAADPTSPFSGGALLGDRVRMSDLATEPGIFIRSMASRGSLGGLTAATREAADLMDAFGFGRVLLETVGVGQAELDIAGSADTTVVVLVPESGDGIQAMKAGLMEVADVFVVNKSDRPGADRLVKEIEVMKKLRRGSTRGMGAGHHGPAPAGEDGGRGTDPGSASEWPGDEAGGPSDGSGGGQGDGPDGPWDIPVLQTVASDDDGVDAVLEAVDAHHEHLAASGELERRRREQLLGQARAVLLRRMERRGREAWEARGEQYGDALADGRLTPYRVADRVEASLEEQAARPVRDETGARGRRGT